MLPTDRLIRIAVDRSGMPTVSRYLPGRGAWVCKHSTYCFTSAVKHKAFDRALRAKFTPSQLSLLFDQIFRPSFTELEDHSTA